MKKYYINNNKEVIDSDAFVACGNDARKALNEEFTMMTLEEAYNYADSLLSWDSVDGEFYEFLADLANLNYSDYADAESLMEDISKVINK